MLRALPLALLAPFFASGCNLACDRGGCDAVQHPIDSPQISAGIAGHIASESDEVANGCAECPLSQVTLSVWSTSMPVTTTADAQALVDAKGQLLDIMANERYEQALDPGNYLACHQGFGPTVCAALTIASGEVFTVNVQAGYGTSKLVVFAPGSSEPTSEGLFALKPVP